MNEDPTRNERATRWKEADRKMSEWSKKVNTLWTKDALAVTSLIDKGNECVIIDGPWGSGKTLNLLPEIERLEIKKGWICVNVDARNIGKYSGASVEKKLENITEILSGRPIIDPKHHTGLMIVDESGSFETEEDLVMFIRECKSRGFSKFVLIPAGGDEAREEIISNSKKALSREGITSTTYKLDKKTLPENITREYFDINHTPTEVVDYFLANFPSYPNIMRFVSIFKTIAQVKSWWEDNRLYFVQYPRGLDIKEIETIDQNIRG